MDEQRPDETKHDELKETSLPFFQPSKIDLGLNIGKNNFSTNARATQEF